MKKMFDKLSLLGLMLAALLLASCSGGSPEKLLNHVPDDAFAVAVFDMSKAIRAFDLSAIEKTSEFKEMKKEMEREYGELVKLYEDVSKNPNKIGIDLTGKIIGFAIIREEFPVMAILAGIDKKTFEKNMDILADELGVNPSELFEEENGIHFFEEGDMLIAYNNDALLVLAEQDSYYDGPDLLPVAEAILKGDRRRSIANDSDFKTFMANCKDVNLWLSSSFVDNDEDTRQLMRVFNDLTGIDYKGNYGHMHLDLGKDELVFTQKLRFNESVTKIDIGTLIENAEDIAMFMDNPARYMRRYR